MLIFKIPYVCKNKYEIKIKNKPISPPLEPDIIIIKAPITNDNLMNFFVLILIQIKVIVTKARYEGSK